MVNIDEEALRNVIKRNDKNIVRRRFPFESLFTLAAYFTTILLADFSGKAFAKYFSYIVFCIYSVYFVYRLVCFFKVSFSSEKLFDEIMGVVEKEHAFSLCVIKSEERYLLKYDKRWKCYLFPYYRTKIENDEESVKSNILRLTGLNQNPDKVLQKEDRKYSYSDGYEKNYNHTYYGFNIEIGKSSLPQKQDSFVIDKAKYKWFSPEELQKDDRIQTRNGEIVKFIEQNF